MLPARKKGASCITASPTCSIVGIFDAATDAVELRQKARKMSALQRHRGPDWSGTHVVDDGDFTSAIAHERLSIVDPDSGEQPLFSKDGTISLAANGEIYNHRELKEGPLAGAYFSSGSDCEVMIPLYEKYGPCAEMVRIRAPRTAVHRARTAQRRKRLRHVAMLRTDRLLARRLTALTESSPSSSWTRRTAPSWRHAIRSAWSRSTGAGVAMVRSASRPR